MNKKVRKTIRRYFGWIYADTLTAIRMHFETKRLRKETDEVIKALEKLDEGPRIFYLGITAQPNLGDMAQHYCIKKWISENYSDYSLAMIEADVICFPKFSFIDKTLKMYYRDGDIIVFQSGYCTQDLGGNHEEMHRLICDKMPYAKILMMPQTVYFQHEENRIKTANSYDKAKKMLFLARDFVSYDQAKSMFPSLNVRAFPDIVTTLIGTMSFDNNRKGVCLCRRNDGEKLYTQAQLKQLSTKIGKETSVCIKDTQGKRPFKEIRENLQQYILEEIESYSHYEITITDRYHGTIFSLCAGTPVIILKTTDHKVITGADWFKGVYDDYVFVANDLDDAYRIYKEVRGKQFSYKLKPHFKNEYYDKLKEIFENN